MKIRLYRSERVWRSRFDNAQSALTANREQYARLVRKLAQAEAELRDLRNAPQPVMPTSLEIVWSDGNREQIAVRSYRR